KSCQRCRAPAGPPYRQTDHAVVFVGRGVRFTPPLDVKLMRCQSKNFVRIRRYDSSEICSAILDLARNVTLVRGSRLKAEPLEIKASDLLAISQKLWIAEYDLPPASQQREVKRQCLPSRHLESILKMDVVLAKPFALVKVDDVTISRYGRQRTLSHADDKYGVKAATWHVVWLEYAHAGVCSVQRRAAICENVGDLGRKLGNVNLGRRELVCRLFKRAEKSVVCLDLFCYRAEFFFRADL